MKFRLAALLSLLALLAACGTNSPTAANNSAETPPAPRHEGGTGFLGGGS